MSSKLGVCPIDLPIITSVSIGDEPSREKFFQFLPLVTPVVVYLTITLVLSILTRFRNFLHFSPIISKGKRTKSSSFFLACSITFAMTGLWFYLFETLMIASLNTTSIYVATSVIPFIPWLILLFLAPYIYKNYPQEDIQHGLGVIIKSKSEILFRLYSIMAFFIPFITYIVELIWVSRILSFMFPVLKQELTIPVIAMSSWLFVSLIGVQRATTQELVSLVVAVVLIAYTLTYQYYLGEHYLEPYYATDFLSTHIFFAYLFAYNAYVLINPAVWQRIASAQNITTLKWSLYFTFILLFLYVATVEQIGMFSTQIYIPILDILYNAVDAPSTRALLYIYVIVILLTGAGYLTTMNVQVYSFFKQNKNSLPITFVINSLALVFIIMIALYSKYSPTNIIFSISIISAVFVCPALCLIYKRINGFSALVGTIFGLISIGVFGYTEHSSFKGIISAYMSSWGSFCFDERLFDIYNYRTLATVMVAVITSTSVTFLVSYASWLIKTNNKWISKSTPLIDHFEKIRSEPISLPTEEFVPTHQEYPISTAPIQRLSSVGDIPRPSVNTQININ